jgi:multidrug efflux system membrane fusion protein
MKAFFSKIHEFQTRKRLLGGALLLLLAGGGYMLYENISATAEPVKAIPIVRTYTVGAQDSAFSAPYPGEVRGRYESQLAFQVGGKISARYVNIGDSVHSGQVLLALDPKDVAQSVESAEAQLASAQANQRLAADNAARYNALYAKGAVSEAIRDQYSTQLQSADAALRQAQAQASVSGNQLGYTHLLSNTDGVIAALNAEVGQIVAAGTPILTVVRGGEREIQINVPEGAPVKLGQQAKITLWALPKVSISGSVREIAPAADSVTRTYKVKVSVPALPEAAKLGMTAKVVLINEEKQTAAIVIPATALYQVNSKAQVWLLKDEKVELRDVEIAGYSDNELLISSGLQANDTIVTAGLNKLSPGLEVRAEQGGEEK